MRGKTFAVQNAKQKAKTTKPRRKEELIHMKFTVEKRLLNEAVTNLQRAVSSKTSIPALEGILIRSEENRLILTAKVLPRILVFHISMCFWVRRCGRSKLAVLFYIYFKYKL